MHETGAGCLRLPGTHQHEGSPLLILISSSPSSAYKSWRKGTDHEETLLNEAEVTTPFWWIVIVATMADVGPGVDGFQ